MQFVRWNDKSWQTWRENLSYVKKVMHLISEKIVKNEN